jgi:hypothetical protein
MKLTTAFSAEVKNELSCTSAVQYVFMALFLIKHRYSFTFIEVIEDVNKLLGIVE